MFEPLDEDYPANHEIIPIDDKEKMTNIDEKKVVTPEKGMPWCGALMIADKETSQPEKFQESFQLGDHIYKWISFAGIPGVLQHHGIVTDITSDTLTLVDFDNILRGEGHEQRTLQVKKRRGRIYISEEEGNCEWKAVKYKAGWIKRSINRSGTCTAIESDPPGLVLSRVKFILDNPDKLPNHHFLKANSECVAVWCKTGAWATLQASSFLHAISAGQVKSAGTLALYVSSQQVVVPATGFWGYLGYTSKVSLLSTQPYLLPAVAGYSLVAVGGPMWILAKCKHEWNETTQRMNNEFWEDALIRPETFAESITGWSHL